MPQDNPPLLDKTMNTTESTPRNLADVLASGLANIANNVKPDGSDISISVPGMSANNVDDGFSELKQSLDGFFPDYTNSSKIIIASGDNDVDNITTESTLTQNGFLRVYVSVGATSGSPFMRILINGAVIHTFFTKIMNTYIYYYSPLFPVKKGDRISVVTGANGVATGTYEVALLPFRT